MKIETFVPKYAFGSNMYIISSGYEYAVIDPSVNYNQVKDRLSGTPKYVIITHAHFDHIGEIDSWVENTGATVICGIGDAPALVDSTLNCYMQFTGENRGYYGPYRAVREGDILTLGEERLRIIETPGHTRGSISILADGAVFVGDVVFLGGGYGRVDLPYGDFKVLISSIKKLKKLDGRVKVYSGHGAPTNVFEIQQNFI